MDRSRSTSPRRGPNGSQRRRTRGQKGAVLVEFGIVAPLLFLVLFAIIDFGWVFSQHLDVRHGAREGARLVSVNASPLDTTGSSQTLALAAATCARMDPAGSTTVEFSLQSSGAGDVGDIAIVEVVSAADQLTGFLDFVLSDLELRSTVEIRLEQEATWSPSVGPVTCL